jgi:S1-C subfamily serine protease
LPGFSGAAALDATGALVGVVTLAFAASGGPQGLLVPTEGLRRFLERAHVALTPAAARPAADCTTGIVRVICTRT